MLAVVDLDKTDTPTGYYRGGADRVANMAISQADKDRRRRNELTLARRMRLGRNACCCNAHLTMEAGNGS